MWSCTIREKCVGVPLCWNHILALISIIAWAMPNSQGSTFAEDANRCYRGGSRYASMKMLATITAHMQIAEGELSPMLRDDCQHTKIFWCGCWSSRPLWNSPHRWITWSKKNGWIKITRKNHKQKFSAGWQSSNLAETRPAAYEGGKAATATPEVVVSQFRI